MENLPHIYFLSPLKFGHLVRKWVSFSISWFVQFLHILSFLGILVYLPVSKKSLWADVRDDLFNSISAKVKNFTNLSDKNKLFWLLNCENQEILNSVGRFLYQNMPCESEKRPYIWELDADLRIGRRLETGRRSESYIYISHYARFRFIRSINHQLFPSFEFICVILLYL
jgi:hypothetical protein